MFISELKNELQNTSFFKILVKEVKTTEVDNIPLFQRGCLQVNTTNSGPLFPSHLGKKHNSHPAGRRAWEIQIPARWGPKQPKNS